MSVRVLNNWPVIKLIAISSLKEIHNIVKELSNNQIQSICEIIVNTFTGNIKISANSKSNLQIYKKNLTYLSDNSHSIENKRKYMLLNKPFLKLIIKSASKHISSLSKNENNRKKSSSALEQIPVSIDESNKK